MDGGSVPENPRRSESPNTFLSRLLTVPRNFHGTESIECKGPLSKATAIEEQKEETQDNFIQFAMICTYAATIQQLPGVVLHQARFYKRHWKKDKEQNISIQDQLRKPIRQVAIILQYGQCNECQKWGPVIRN